MLRLRRSSASLHSGSALHDTVLVPGELAARLEAAPVQIVFLRSATCFRCLVRELRVLAPWRLVLLELVQTARAGDSVPTSAAFRLVTWQSDAC